MSEQITIDGLPEGYYVSGVKTYHDLYAPGGRYLTSMSKRFKHATIEKKFIDEAEKHAAKTSKHRRTKAEEAFCKGFSNEQLEAVSLSDLHAILLDLQVGIRRNVADYTFWIETISLDMTLTKLEAHGVQS